MSLKQAKRYTNLVHKPATEQESQASGGKFLGITVYKNNQPLQGTRKVDSQRSKRTEEGGGWARCPRNTVPNMSDEMRESACSSASMREPFAQQSGWAEMARWSTQAPLVLSESDVHDSSTLRFQSQPSTPSIERALLVCLVLAGWMFLSDGTCPVLRHPLIWQSHFSCASARVAASKSMSVDDHRSLLSLI